MCRMRNVVSINCKYNLLIMKIYKFNDNKLKNLRSYDLKCLVSWEEKNTFGKYKYFGLYISFEDSLATNSTYCIYLRFFFILQFIAK